jgi:hypothetical protein
VDVELRTSGEVIVAFNARSIDCSTRV